MPFRAPTRDHHAVPTANVPPRPEAEQLRISVVIPAKNEAPNLPWVLPRIPLSVDEVVLVDGLSTDESIAVARMTLPHVKVVHETRPGKGAAVRAGFKVASGDVIVMLDADGSMDPLEIPRFIDAIRDGADFVKGSRFLAGGGTTDMTWVRRTGNAALRAIANLLYRTRFTDLCYGYCAMRRSALERIELDADGFDIEMQLIARMHRAGVSGAEVPSLEQVRRFGTSNLRALPDGWRVLKALLRERFARPSAHRAVPIAIESRAPTGDVAETTS